MEGRGGGRTERGEDVPEPVLEGLGVSYGAERCEAAYDDEHGVCVGEYVVELYTVQQSIGRQKIHYTRQRASLGDISMPICGSGGAGPPYNPFRLRTTQISLVLERCPQSPPPPYQYPSPQLPPGSSLCLYLLAIFIPSGAMSPFPQAAKLNNPVCVL